MNSFKDVIKDLQETECLSDVTLVCNDDTRIKAHKFVLIGSSPVLRKMLLHSSHQDTFVYLRGVERSELEWALQFMYLGQTQVPKTHLQSFINLARDLQMKGIHDEEDIVTNAKLNEVEVNNVAKAMDTGGTDNDDMPSKQENLTEEVKDISEGKTFKVKAKSDFVRFHLRCHLCPFVAKNNSHLLEHIESVHEGVRYPCDLCDYKANRQQNLKDHKAGVHKIDPHFKCLLCDYCTNHTKWWKKHAESMHPSYQVQDIFKVTAIKERKRGPQIRFDN